MCIYYIKLIGFNVREYEPNEPVRGHEACGSHHERKGIDKQQGVEEEENCLKEAIHD